MTGKVTLSQWIHDKRVKHGGYGTQLYRKWINMRSRCKYPCMHNYANYGGKGVKVCISWEDFVSFRTWSEANGYEEGLEIDRIDRDGNYCPANCRYITKEANLARRLWNNGAKNFISLSD